MFSFPGSALCLLLKLQATLRFLLLVLVAYTATFSHAAFAGPLIDINIASADVLAGTLPGIGPTKAKAIVDYRDLNGPYQSIDELTNVKGIGEVTLSKIKPFLFRVGQSSEQSRLYPSVSSRTRVVLNASGQNTVGEGLTDTPNHSEAQARKAIRAALNIALRRAEQTTQP